MRKTGLICTIFLFTFSLKAQYSQRLLVDTFPKLAYNSTLEMVSDGSSFVVNANGITANGILQSTLVSVDTSGNVIWRYIDPVNHSFEEILKSDSFIYAWDGTYVIKLNYYTGQYIWKSPLLWSFELSLVDYDKTKFFYALKPTNGIIFLDKATGTIADTFGGVRTGGIAVDSMGKIYGGRDNIFTKYDPDNNCQPIWSDTIHDINADVSSIYLDKAQNLYVLSSNYTGILGRGQVDKINPNTGDSIWRNVMPVTWGNLYNSYTVLGAFADDGNNLDIAWTDVSSTYGSLIMQQISKGSGNTNWLASDSTPGYKTLIGEAGASVLAIDTNGDIYITGSYYEPHGDFPSAFILSKINGANGDAIFNNGFTLSPPNLNVASNTYAGGVGRGLALKNGSVYVFSLLQAGEDTINYNFGSDEYVAFMKGSAVNGQINTLRFLNSKNKFSSNVARIEPYENNTFIAISQIGRCGVVSLYDNNLNEIWARQFVADYYLTPSDVQVHNSKIYVSATSTTTVQNPIAIAHMYVLDGAGNLLHYAHDYLTVLGYGGPTQILPLKNRIVGTFGGAAVAICDTNGILLNDLNNSGSSYLQQELQPYQRMAYNDTAFYFANWSESPDSLRIKTVHTSSIDSINIYNSYINTATAGSSKILYNGWMYEHWDSIKPYTALVDLNLNDTVWLNYATRDSAPLTDLPGIESYISVWDSGSAVYSLASTDTSNYTGSLLKNTGFEARKIDFNTGRTLWAFKYQNDTIHRFLQLNDVAYNNYYKKVICAGFRQRIVGADTIADLIAFSISTDGAMTDTFILPGVHSSSNTITRVISLGRYGNFICGTYEDSTGMQAGFLARLENTIASGDSVWPGDANEDGIVDVNDLFSIGVAYGQSGASRAVTAINWAPQFAHNWVSAQPGGVNDKFADCNGDGIINATDTLAIIQNFNLTHARGVPSPSYINGQPALSLYPHPGSTNAGSMITCDIILGNSSLPVEDIYGIAFQLNVDPLYINDNSVNVNYSASWLANENNFLDVVKRVSTTTYTALVGTDHLNKSGWGKIGQLSFTLNNNVTPELLYNAITLSSITAVDTALNTLTVNRDTAFSNAIAGIADNSGFNPIQIYPNPAENNLVIETYQLMDQSMLTIIDITGKQIITMPLLKDKTVIDVSRFTDGFYIVEINIGGSIRRASFVKQ